jgi:hypothetical protein
VDRRSGADAPGISEAVTDNPHLRPSQDGVDNGRDQDPPDIGPGASIPRSHSFFPSQGGYRLTVSTVPGQTSVQTPQKIDKKAVLAEVESKLPGLTPTLRAGSWRDRTTRTTSYAK